MSDEQPSVWDYDPSDSLSRISPTETRFQGGLYVRCAHCKVELGLHLLECRNQEGAEYDNVYGHTGPLKEEAPFFCDNEDGCWQDLETEREPNMENVLNW